MANKYRGEITAELNDRKWTLCLTLGALADLEDHFDAADLPQLAEKLAKGSFCSADLKVIISAGLKGGGHEVTDEDISEMRCADGVTGYAAIVAELLTASFSVSAQSKNA